MDKLALMGIKQGRIKIIQDEKHTEKKLDNLLKESFSPTKIKK
jgi:hypothetical protein